MTGKETDNKEDRAKSEGSGSMGPEMFEMMKKCCTGMGGLTNCSTMMKDMMGKMKSHPCCSPGTEDIESERRKK